MTEDLQLRADLTALAGQVRADRLDLPALTAVAQRRRRRRRLAVLAPGLVALLVAGGLLAGLSRHGTDTLTTAQAPATTGPRVAVTASLRAAAPGLSVRPNTASAPLSRPTRLGLSWTLAPEAAPVQLAWPAFRQEVTADQGGGVVGVTDGHCWSWDSDGRGLPNPCPPTVPIDLRAGDSVTTDLVVSDVLKRGRAADGVYRFTIGARPLGIVDVELRVTGTAAGPSPPAATAARAPAPAGDPGTPEPLYVGESRACSTALPAGTVRSGRLQATDQVVAARTCRQDTPSSPIMVRNITGESLQAIADALRKPTLPAKAVCDASGRVLPDFALQLTNGRWIHPEIPSDGCHPTDDAVQQLNNAAR